MATPMIKQWLKQKFIPHKKQTTSDGSVGTRQDDHGGSPPPRPVLLAGRDEWPTIPMSAGDGVATDYGLFGTLPSELRRQILGYAFGHRTLHLDLTFDHPLTRSAESCAPAGGDQEGKPNKTVRRTHCGLDSDLVRNTTHPKQWQWVSCVCHRRLVRTDEDWGGPVRKARIEPCEDGCIPGHRVGAGIYQLATTKSESLCYCESTDPNTSQQHGWSIGVLSWLLACRQAYHDGTHILYTTNTFHIASLPLLHSLPRLLPPHHLSTVTSLELLFSFSSDTLFNSEIMASAWADAQEGGPSSSTAAEAAARKRTRFHGLCDMVPATFPNVHRLYIALQAHIVPPASFSSEDILGDVERVVLGPVEDMFRTLGPGQEGTGRKEFSLAIQKGGWEVFTDRLTARDTRARRYLEEFDEEEDGNGGSYREKVWKPLTEGGEGYWLRPGWDDFEVFGSEYWTFNLWGTDD